VSVAHGNQSLVMTGQGWAGNNVENVEKPLVLDCNPRKLCEEWNL